jgi:hypothetical protein
VEQRGNRDAVQERKRLIIAGGEHPSGKAAGAIEENVFRSQNLLKMQIHLCAVCNQKREAGSRLGDSVIPIRLRPARQDGDDFLPSPSVIRGVVRGSDQLISMNLLPGTLQMGQVSGMVFSTVLPQTGQM